MCKQRGFTLIELMIVVVVVSILAAIAFPAYQESVAKSKRADAQGALMSLAGAMERAYTENNSYCYLVVNNDGSDSGSCPESPDDATDDIGPPASHAATVPLDGGTAYYDLTISAVTPDTYTLTATRTGSMAGDKCGDFTLTHTGIQGITNAAAGITVNDCWR